MTLQYEAWSSTVFNCGTQKDRLQSLMLTLPSRLSWVRIANDCQIEVWYTFDVQSTKCTLQNGS